MTLILVLWGLRGAKVYIKVNRHPFPHPSTAKCPSRTLTSPPLSTRNQRIQAEMTNRAIELLALPPRESLFLLDIGCGSGLSGEILDDLGHVWAGVDIAPSMLREYPFKI